MFFLGCQRLSDYLEGVKKNYESAAQVLKHNCETNGHGESCYKLGAYHVTGKGKTGMWLRPIAFLKFVSDITLCVAQIGTTLYVCMYGTNNMISSC